MPPPGRADDDVLDHACRGVEPRAVHDREGDAVDPDRVRGGGENDREGDGDGDDDHQGHVGEWELI